MYCINRVSCEHSVGEAGQDRKQEEVERRPRQAPHHPHRPAEQPFFSPFGEPQHNAGRFVAPAQIEHIYVGGKGHRFGIATGTLHTAANVTQNMTLGQLIHTAAERIPRVLSGTGHDPGFAQELAESR